LVIAAPSYLEEMAQVPVAPAPGQVDAIIADLQPEPAENANAVVNDENQREPVANVPEIIYSCLVWVFFFSLLYFVM